MTPDEAIKSMKQMFGNSDKIVKVFVNQEQLILYLIGVIRVLCAGDVPNFEELETKLAENGYDYDEQDEDEELSDKI